MAPCAVWLPAPPGMIRVRLGLVGISLLRSNILRPFGQSVPTIFWPFGPYDPQSVPTILRPFGPYDLQSVPTVLRPFSPYDPQSVPTILRPFGPLTIWVGFHSL